MASFNSHSATNQLGWSRRKDDLDNELIDNLLKDCIKADRPIQAPPWIYPSERTRPLLDVLIQIYSRNVLGCR